MHVFSARESEESRLDANLQEGARAGVPGRGLGLSDSDVRRSIVPLLSHFEPGVRALSRAGAGVNKLQSV